MLGKWGIAGIAFVATALMAGGTAHAVNFTEVSTCKTDGCLEKESIARAPYGAPRVLSAAAIQAAQACSSPVRVPLGQDEIALCEDAANDGRGGSYVSLARLKLDGRETQLRLSSGGGALLFTSEINLRTGDDQLRIVSECNAYPDPYVEQGECLPLP